MPYPFNSRLSKIEVAQITKAIEEERKKPTGLSAQWIAYRQASERARLASASAQKLSSTTQRLTVQKREWQQALDDQHKIAMRLAEEQQGLGFFDFGKRRDLTARLSEATSRLGRTQAAAITTAPSNRFRLFQAASLSAAEDANRQRAALDAASAALINAAPAYASASAQGLSSGLTEEQIGKYQNGDFDAIWTRHDVELLQLQVRTTVGALDPGGIALNGVFEKWNGVYTDLFLGTEDAYKEVNRVASQYMAAVDKRRQFYLGIATGLLKIVADKFGAGFVVDFIGQGVTWALEQFETNAAQVVDFVASTGGEFLGAAAGVVRDNVTGRLADEASAAQAEIPDKITEAVVDKAEETHSRTLAGIRENISKGYAAVDGFDDLAKLRERITDALNALRDTVATALQGDCVKVGEQEVCALLRVMAQRKGLATLLQTPNIATSVLRQRHHEVFQAAKEYYDARAAVILNEIFAKYDCPSEAGRSEARMSRLRPVMRKWIFAKYLQGMDHATLRDMANAYTGFLGREESALVDVLLQLQVLTRRESRGGLDDAGNRANFAIAEAGQRFTVGYGHVGDPGTRAIKAWAQFFANQNPLKLAAA